MKLDIGCGTMKHDGYIGIDAISSPGVDIIHDVREGIPYDAGTIDGIWNQSFIEHLSFGEAKRFLMECYRVLKPGGELVTVTLNFVSICKKFISVDESLRWTGINYEFYGSQANEYEFHKSCYTKEFIARLLGEVGFKNITVEDFTNVEVFIAKGTK